MTAPTLPSLPPDLREKIDAYREAIISEPRVSELAGRAALDAALLPYVQDAERFRWLDVNPYAIKLRRPASPPPAVTGTGVEIRPGVYLVAPNDGDERPDEDEFTVAPPAVTGEAMTEDQDVAFLQEYAASMRRVAEQQRRDGQIFGPECADVQAPIFERIARRLRASLPSEREGQR